MSKKSSFKKSFVSIVWKFIVIGGVVAFFMIKGGPEGAIQYFKNKSEELRPQILACLNNGDCEFKSLANSNNNENSNNNANNQQNNDLAVNNSSNTNKQSMKENNNPPVKNSVVKLEKKMTKKEAKDSLSKIKIVDKYDDVNYKRTEWRHWSSFEKACWNTREEALFRQSTPEKLVLTDKDGNIVNNKDNACGIKEGEWKDPYSEEVITDPAKADLDHTIPLKLAARMGGQNWTKQYKEEFANDLEHLVITTQKQNRTKGDKGPSSWMPPNVDSHCEYAIIFINTAKKYELNISKDDKMILEIALDSCK